MLIIDCLERLEANQTANSIIALRCAGSQHDIHLGLQRVSYLIVTRSFPGLPSVVPQRFMCTVGAIRFGYAPVLRSLHAGVDAARSNGRGKPGRRADSVHLRHRPVSCLSSIDRSCP